MEEVKAFAFFFTFQHFFCKFVVFIHDLWKIFFFDRIIFCVWCNNGFNRNLFETFKLRFIGTVFYSVAVRTRMGKFCA